MLLWQNRNLSSITYIHREPLSQKERLQPQMYTVFCIQKACNNQSLYQEDQYLSISTRICELLC